MRLVPICFAVIDDTLVGAVDHKPKRVTELRRLDDMRASGRATVLIDHYDDAEWARLWWVRIRGAATVHEPEAPDARAVRDALMAKYRQYHERPPAGPAYRVAIDEVRSWRYTAS